MYSSHIKQYCISRDYPRCFVCDQNATFKNYPKHDENHFNAAILVHLTWNTALKIWKRLLVAGYRIFWNLKFHLTHSLHPITHSLTTWPQSQAYSPNKAGNSHHFMPQQQQTARVHNIKREEEYPTLHYLVKTHCVQRLHHIIDTSV